MRLTMDSNIKVKVLVLSAIAVACLFSSCKKKDVASDVAKSEPEEITYAVNAYRISEGSLDDYLEFGGDVASVASVDIIPDQAGKISRILVSVGDMVTKDQVVAYVDASRPGVNYKASPVKSPISGRIISFTPMIGSTVSQSMSVAKVSSTDDLEIKTSVAERFISRIKLGQAASVTFDAYPGQVFSAHVTEVSPVLDTTTRTMAIKLRLDKSDSRIKVGMYARIKLVTETVNDVIVVPSNTIVTRDNNTYVYLVNIQSTGEGNVRMQPVEKGLSVDNKCEIISGLSVGQCIISKGQSLLNDGSKVNVVSIDEGGK